MDDAVTPHHVMFVPQKRLLQLATRRSMPCRRLLPWQHIERRLELVQLDRESLLFTIGIGLLYVKMVFTMYLTKIMDCPPRLLT